MNATANALKILGQQSEQTVRDVALILGVKNSNSAILCMDAIENEVTRSKTAARYLCETVESFLS